MAQSNQISIVIAPELHDQMMKHVAELRELLKPFTHALSIDERRSLTKMGDKTHPFVQKALEYARTNKEFIAPSIDAAEWQKDYDGWEKLHPLKNQLAQLLSDVDDTILLLGAESYDPARFYYTLAKEAASRGDSSAKPIVEDLSRRFVKASRKKIPASN